MKASLKKVGTWSQWIGSAALALALGGLFAPAITYAVTCDDCVGTGETIPVTGEAPFNPPNYGGHGGGGAPNGTPSGDMGGGGGGGSGGGGVFPNKGGSKPKPQTTAQRVASQKAECGLALKGVWSTAIFHDYDTNVAFAGYVCSFRLNDGTYGWHYYDSEGFLNQRCSSPNLEVEICEAP